MILISLNKRSVFQKSVTWKSPSVIELGRSVYGLIYFQNGCYSWQIKNNGNPHAANQKRLGHQAQSDWPLVGETFVLILDNTIN